MSEENLERDKEVTGALILKGVCLETPTFVKRFYVWCSILNTTCKEYV